MNCPVSQLNCPEQSGMFEYCSGRKHAVCGQDAVEAVMGILGMAPCDGSDAVPPNARSHTLLLAGRFVGDAAALARVSFGIDIGRNVAMKLVTRSDVPEISDFIHQIIQS